MFSTLEVSTLTLAEVERLLKFERCSDSNSISTLLNLEPLNDAEQQDLLQIVSLFNSYYKEGKITEGQVKFLFLAPLMRLAGFYQPQIKILLEENLAEIAISEEDTVMRGRMDILAVDKIAGNTTTTALWILVIESKNSAFEPLEGLPPSLAYCYKSLEQQSTTWGLATNGLRYHFVYVEREDSPVYQLFPDLSLLYVNQAVQLLQILKAISKL